MRGRSFGLRTEEMRARLRSEVELKFQESAVMDESFGRLDSSFQLRLSFAAPPTDSRKISTLSPLEKECSNGLKRVSLEDRLQKNYFLWLSRQRC